MKILIIEDDPIMRKMIIKAFKNESVEIFESETPVKGLEILKKEEPQVLILDIMLPEMDGYSVCEIIRRYPNKYCNPYIMMLSSKKKDENIIKGLNYGADDYITKPFNPKELLARYMSIKRRISSSEDKYIFVYKNIEIDTKKEVVINKTTGDAFELFKKEYEIVLYFVKNQGIVLTRTNIHQNLWNEEYLEGNRSLDNYIWKIKKKIKDFNNNIKSVRGMGYKLNR